MRISMILPWGMMRRPLALTCRVSFPSPVVYVRYILGAIFVLWLPGYALIKALFPSRQLDSIERVALSIGLSLALDAIVGLLLNYTPWGIRLAPITLSLLALTVAFATAALVRDQQNKLRASK